MAVPDVKEKWTGAVNEVTIGATEAEGGTRKSTITIGGEKSLPFLHAEGEMPNPPVIALEINDIAGEDWAETCRKPYGDAIGDVESWAKKAMELGADLLCLRLTGTHPDVKDISPDGAAATVKKILGAVGAPLIVWGCGMDEKDNVVLPKCTEAARGENCLFGTITEKNYRTLVAACMAGGHKLIGESPLDINIAKQVNILAVDMGFKLEDIVMFPTTGALGYGMEYVYSIQERMRVAALGGDKLLQPPIIMDVGAEAWRAKEARAADEDVPGWGPAAERGTAWEAATAVNLLLSGGDIIVLRHPDAVPVVREAINRLMAS